MSFPAGWFLVGDGLTGRLRRGLEFSPYGFLGSFGIRRFPKGERKALWCARRRNPPFSNEGMTRRLRRGRWGCRPEGGSTFFRSERKYQRKHAARRLREKGFYCPFCRRGSQCRAQWSWPAFAYGRSALVLAFFRRQNGRAFFPPLPIAALLRRSWRWADSNGGAWNVSALHSRFCKAKGQRHFKTMLAFGASRRACRPTAVCTGQLAGNRTRPASREACRRAAVKPRTTCMSLYAPARHRRAVRGQGALPLG